MDDDFMLLKDYIANNITPVLVKDSMYDVVSSLGETIDASCSLDDLNGYYDEENNFKPPKWYDKVKEKKLLIIKNIDSIPVKEQKKFGEILKYKKVNEFSLDDCFVILTYGDKELSRDILSLAAKV